MSNQPRFIQYHALRCFGLWVLWMATFIGLTQSDASDIRPTPPGKNRADEPLAASFSANKAVEFIDRSAAYWWERRDCVTCHTTGLYLAARPLVGHPSPNYQAARKKTQDYLRRFVIEKETPHGQHGSIEGIVASTAFLAMSDVLMTGRLEPLSRACLDHVWSLQSDSGAWPQWLKCHWGPYEVDDHFGATLVAVAVGMAPDHYAHTETSREGLRRLTGYLNSHPPTTGHQKGMTLWASRYLPELITEANRQQWIADLLNLQNPDGGWALIQLGDADWKREDDKPQDQCSDGYATGFVIYVLRQAGVVADHQRIRRGIHWLKQHQRASGRWFVRSPRRDGRHYITQAGTQFAVMALAECDALFDSRPVPLKE